jgi:hypothetical protein
MFRVLALPALNYPELAAPIRWFWGRLCNATCKRGIHKLGHCHEVGGCAADKDPGRDNPE